MKSNINQLKNLVILLTEITAILLMVFNILPRELSWFLTGLLIFYFIFSPLEDSLGFLLLLFLCLLLCLLKKDLILWLIGESYQSFYF